MIDPRPPLSVNVAWSLSMRPQFTLLPMNRYTYFKNVSIVSISIVSIAALISVSDIDARTFSTVVALASYIK